MAMSGPIPARPPRVSASGGPVVCRTGRRSCRRSMRGSRHGTLFDLDHRLFAQLREVALGLGLEFLREHLVAYLLGGGAVELVGLLGAKREHLDALRRDLGARELADLDVVEDLAQLGGEIGGRL